MKFSQNLDEQNKQEPVERRNSLFNSKGTKIAFFLLVTFKESAPCLLPTLGSSANKPTHLPEQSWGVPVSAVTLQGRRNSEEEIVPS